LNKIKKTRLKKIKQSTKYALQTREVFARPSHSSCAGTRGTQSPIHRTKSSHSKCRSSLETFQDGISHVCYILSMINPSKALEHSFFRQSHLLPADLGRQKDEEGGGKPQGKALSVAEAAWSDSTRDGRESIQIERKKPRFRKMHTCAFCIKRRKACALCGYAS
jgi:hypothetical protein